jgi:hypothetical protein
MEHPLFLWEMIAIEQGASTEAIVITGPSYPLQEIMVLKFVAALHRMSTNLASRLTLTVRSDVMMS